MQTPLRKSSAVSLTLEAFFFLLEQWWIRNPGEKKKKWCICPRWSLQLLYIYMMFENNHDYKM